MSVVNVSSFFSCFFNESHKRVSTKSVNVLIMVDLTKILPLILRPVDVCSRVGPLPLDALTAPPVVQGRPKGLDTFRGAEVKGGRRPFDKAWNVFRILQSCMYISVCVCVSEPFRDIIENKK